VKSDPAQKVRRVEFVGLPGAGKTTLCRAILAALPDDGRSLSHGDALDLCLLKRPKAGLPGKIVKTLPASFWKPLVGLDCSIAEFHHFSLKHTTLMQQVFCILSRFEIKEEWRSCVLYVFLRLAIEDELLRSCCPGSTAVFVEEGFVQAVLSAFGYLPLSHAVLDDDIARYIDSCPLPDNVIWVNTQPDVCLSRLLARPELPLALADGDRLQRLVYFKDCIESAMRHLELRGVNVWHIDRETCAGKTVDESAQDWIRANF
jgi:hypothetical protein